MTFRARASDESSGVGASGSTSFRPAAAWGVRFEARDNVTWFWPER